MLKSLLEFQKNGLPAEKLPTALRELGTAIIMSAKHYNKLTPDVVFDVTVSMRKKIDGK